MSLINLESAAVSYSTNIGTQVSCKYNRITEILNKISCDCSPVSSNASYSCFESRTSVKIGFGRICPSTQSTILAPPAYIEFNANSLIDYTSSNCISVEVEGSFIIIIILLIILELLASQFEVSKKYSLSYSSATFNAEKYNAYAAIVNSDKATVGQLIGDGIKLSFDVDVDYYSFLFVYG